MVTKESIANALSLLPKGQEVDMDVFREQLQASDPDGWKETMQHLMVSRQIKRRLDTSNLQSIKVFLSDPAKATE